MGVVIVEFEGAILGVNLGHPIVTSRDGDALFPNYLFWERGACMFCCVLVHVI